MTERIYIHAAAALGPHGDYRPEQRRKLTSDAPLTPLKPLVKEIIGQPLRQASHFIELAALGAMLCLKKLPAPPPANTGVYLGTGLADVHKNEAVFRQVVLENGPASPFDFINAANNMAAFYVARLAQVASRNYTIMQNEFSFENALQLASNELRDGIVDAALVGGVDEFCPPRSAHLQRLPLPESAFMGEGSGWLYLSRDADGAIAELVEVTADVAVNQTVAERRISNEPLYLLPGFRMSVEDIARLRSGLNATQADYLDSCGCYHTAAAFGVSSMLEQEWRPATVLHVNRDQLGRSAAILLRTP